VEIFTSSTAKFLNKGFSMGAVVFDVCNGFRCLFDVE